MPEGLTAPAWHLFAIFAATIASVIVGAFPILTASVLAVGIAVLSRVLTPAKAYAGFANGTILLIVVAFLVARAIVKCGLGARLGHLVVRLFGRSTLGLGYSIFVFDAVIAPAFPSDTARSGVLYPLALSLAEGGGSRPDEATRKRMGAYLMFCALATLSLSSALWLTAMAGNPLGAEIAKAQGFHITFVSWLVASAVPTLVLLALLPLLIYKVFPPEVKATPEAPAAARKALAAMGPLSAPEKIVAATFVVMVVLWGLAGTLKIDLTAVAFLGLGVLLASGVLTLDDIKQQGDVLGTFIWFAILYTLERPVELHGLHGLPRPAARKLLERGAEAGGIRHPGPGLRRPPLSVRQPDGARARPLRRLPGCRSPARRAGARAGVRSAFFDELPVHDHAPGLERKRARRRERVPDAGRALQARHDHDGLQPSRPASRGNALAALRHPVNGGGTVTYIQEVLRRHPELAIFLTLTLGFVLGRIRLGSFQMGNVVGTLLAGVLIGQLDIHVDPVVKIVFFDLFLFATGYKVGPQFIRGLGKNALPQVALTVVLCVTSLVTTVAAAKIFHYDCGTAAGLMAGAFTESTVIGTAGDTIQRLDLPQEEKTRLLNNIPVAYAVSYLVGTGFVVWFLSSLAPKLLKVDLKAESAKLEKEITGGQGAGPGSAVGVPGMGPARLPDRRRGVGGSQRSGCREDIRPGACLHRANPPRHDDFRR